MPASPRSGAASYHARVSQLPVPIPWPRMPIRPRCAELARQVGAREVAPRAGEGDESGEVPWDAVKAMAAADLFRVTIGTEWGGLGLGDVEAAIVLEEIARWDVSTAICCQLAFNGPSRGIEHLGGDALKERYLPAVADGESIISIGITEPDAGSAVQEMRAALRPTAPPVGGSTPTRTTRPSAMPPRRCWCGAGGRAARGPRALARSSCPWTATG